MGAQLHHDALLDAASIFSAHECWTQDLQASVSYCIADRVGRLSPLEVVALLSLGADAARLPLHTSWRSARSGAAAALMATNPVAILECSCFRELPYIMRQQSVAVIAKGNLIEADCGMTHAVCRMPAVCLHSGISLLPSVMSGAAFQVTSWTPKCATAAVNDG